MPKAITNQLVTMTIAFHGFRYIKTWAWIIIKINLRSILFLNKCGCDLNNLNTNQLWTKGSQILPAKDNIDFPQSLVDSSSRTQQILHHSWTRFYNPKNTQRWHKKDHGLVLWSNPQRDSTGWKPEREGAAQCRQPLKGRLFPQKSQKAKPAPILPDVPP